MIKIKYILILFMVIFSVVLLSSCNIQENDNKTVSTNSGTTNNNTGTANTNSGITNDNNEDNSPSSLTGSLGYNGVDKTGLGLKVSDNFSISIFADNLPGARDIVGPDALGNFWLSRTKEGIITLLGTSQTGAVNKDDIFDGLNNPHGLALSQDGLTLYYAETDKISKVELYTEGTPKKLVELPEGGRHFTRSLIFGDDEKLYVSIGGSCDVCYEEDERLASIYRLDTDGSNFEKVATGLRNSVFMDKNPINGDIWATEMGRDNLGDNTPPDEINIIKNGNDYGWPICYGNNVHDNQFDKNTYVNNPCENKIPAHIELQAHSAPLGLSFIPKEGWPKKYGNDLLVAYHGSWNRTIPTGYKIMHFILDEKGNIQDRREFISGWLSDNGDVSGRVVDILLTNKGTGYITDDEKGVVYKINYNNPDSKVIDQISFSDDENNIKANIEVNKNREIFINGEASGTWYFEAIFDLEVVDENGNILNKKPITANGEWMTENYVPFNTNFNYSEPETDYGYVIFKKANPSGMPENELEKKIQIKLR